MTKPDDSLNGLLQEYMEQRIDRRAFFKRAGLIGVSVATAANVLSTFGAISKAAAATGTRLGAAGPLKGGTLIQGYDRDFTKMDTVQSGWADPGYYALYEFVQVRNPQGGISNGMAESVTISPDGKTWTIKVRDGLIESTQQVTYFFLSASYPVTPLPSNFCPPNSPVKSKVSQSPPSPSL